MVTASMIVRSNVILPPTLSVEFVAMLVTWLEIVRIDSVVLTGVMVLLKVLLLVAARLLDVLAEVTLSIVNTR